ncbi:hypothetical protein MLD52_04305 [Puniceicoccaceae bacterium K14]|nr:hypothetical protein [Puniceicoccaceae bacterium K14]
MENFDNESQSDNNWDDHNWESAWNEFDWERYLKSEDNEVLKYQKLYSKLVKSQNRLDEVALYMGWDSANLPEQTSIDSSSGQQLENSEAPYTLHRHPLFIASKALHSWLQEKWMQHSSLASQYISPELALKLSSSFSQSDYQGLLAVMALDMGDYALAIAYLKRGMASINDSFAALEEISQLEIEPLPRYVTQAKIRLFDIRDIWLRVVADCRAAVAKKSEEE